MSDILLAAITVAFFALAIGLVNLLGRVIAGGDSDWLDDDPPDTEAEPRQGGLR